MRRAHFFLPLFLICLLGLGCNRIRPASEQLAPGLHGQIYYPQSDESTANNPSHPGVVLLHGSGGMRPVYHQEAQLLAEQGYVALVLDYYANQEFGGFSGSERSRRWLLWQDATVSAAQFLALQPGVDPERIALVGFSQGAALAVTSAHRLPKLRALVDFFGPNVEEWYVEVFFNQKKTLPSDYLERMPPTLILHGSADPIVSVKDSERFYQQLKLRNKDAELQIYRGSLHALNDPAGDSEQARQVAEHARYRMIEFLNTRVRDYPVPRP